MDIEKHWPDIKAVFQNAQLTCRHCAIATVNEDGSPHITPVGSLFLRDNCTGYYFEEYSQKMAINFKHNNRVCVLAINSGIRYWFKSILLGRFPSPPGVRLYGIVGQRRLGTKDEMESFQNRVRVARKFKGYKLIWKNMKHVREIHFKSFEPVHAAKMTQHLW
jgi:hypothetical protein